MTVQFKTDGRGYWSNVSAYVNITDIKLDTEYGELKVYFDESWNVAKDGLIYTDRQFEKDLKSFLKLHGLPANGVSYSEQGMQGYNFVSLDASDKFTKAWKQKFGV